MVTHNRAVSARWLSVRYVLAALAAAVAAAGVVAVATSSHPAKPRQSDRPLHQPSHLFPSTWPGMDGLDARDNWSSGGALVLRASADTGPVERHFTFGFRASQADTGFALVVRCDAGC